MITKSLLAFAVMTFGATAALALPPGIHSNPKTRTVSVDRGAMPFVRPVRHIPKGSKVIYSNIDYYYPKGYYFCCYGSDIAGPDSALGFQVWTAIAFTPVKSGEVTEIEAGIGYIEGDQSINFGIWSDANGVPGVEIAGADETVSQIIGNCCALLTFKKKVPVTAGTQYWVVASTDANNTTAFSSWLSNSTNVVDTAKEAYNEGSGWVAENYVPAISFTVYGK